MLIIFISIHVTVEVYDISIFGLNVCCALTCIFIICFQVTGSITNTTTNDQVDFNTLPNTWHQSPHSFCSLKTHSVFLLKVCKPVQHQSELSTQNCSMEKDEKEGMRDEKRSDEGRGELEL